MCDKTIKQNVKILEKLETLIVKIAVLKEQGINNSKEHALLREALEKQDKRISNNTNYINKALGGIGFITLIGWVGIKSLFTN